jgi:pimeloyl-ACP methyl ester carboxylesterase
MATFVLVHGAGHGGWCYQRVTRLLSSAGHRVYTPTMTGVGERSHLVGPHVDLNLHIEDIAAVLHYEDLRDVILVGHSYGGTVVAGVGGMVPDRVGKLVYLDAPYPRNGQSLADVASPMIEMTRSDGQTVDGVELVLLPSPEAGRRYGVTDPGDLAWMAPRLTGHPWKCFEQKLALHDEAGYAEIPEFHIICTARLATSDPDLMAEARAAGRLWEIDTGHDLMITEPQRVAEALLAVAAD